MILKQTQKMILLVDIGNSSIKWALSSSKGMSDMLQQTYGKDISMDFFISCWQYLLDMPNEIIVSCVANESVWQALDKACHSLWNLSATRVTSLKEGFGLVSAYDDFLSLGCDRWCAMIAAKDRTDSSYIVIDAGSALTIDVVHESGKHLGGYITPGIAMMKKSLGLNTAQIILAKETSTPSLGLGKSTIDCVEAGLHLSAIRLIEAVIDEELNKTKSIKVYITGGDANMLALLLSVKCVIIPDLVLQGVAIAAANNDSK